MKYMGSKRYMLENGFGSTITAVAPQCERVVDLFSGSAAVSWYVAENFSAPVLAVDLQSYSAVLARAVIGRTHALDLERVKREWLEPTRRSARAMPQWREVGKYDSPDSKTAVQKARQLCDKEEAGPIWSAYGGHYFSPRQALLIDRGLRRLPARDPYHSVCRAALIAAAAYCAASPGHTAQPFQPTDSALPYIRESWTRDPLRYAERWLGLIADSYALTKGSARVGDANEVAASLSADDLVIVDPPYSAVQYSRFYHVLEAIATLGEAEAQQVSGAGRYPPLELRPSSDFSKKGQSQSAIVDLLETLADVGCRAIITFPKERCSNGLSGVQIAQIARRCDFAVTTKSVRGSFSTLGGNGTIRDARHASRELIITLAPRS
jgi:adenine-specific DNA-methyltransferase